MDKVLAQGAARPAAAEKRFVAIELFLTDLAVPGLNPQQHRLPFPATISNTHAAEYIEGAWREARGAKHSDPVREPLPCLWDRLSTWGVNPFPAFFSREERGHSGGRSPDVECPLRIPDRGWKGRQHLDRRGQPCNTVLLCREFAWSQEGVHMSQTALNQIGIPPELRWDTRSHTTAETLRTVAGLLLVLPKDMGGIEQSVFVQGNSVAGAQLIWWSCPFRSLLDRTSVVALLGDHEQQPRHPYLNPSGLESDPSCA